MTPSSGMFANNITGALTVESSSHPNTTTAIGLQLGIIIIITPDHNTRTVVVVVVQHSGIYEGIKYKKKISTGELLEMALTM